jgi:HK97 family phage prohead protease
MKITHKSFALREIKLDADTRTVEGWASTFGNKDSGDDIILKGAFSDSLKQRMPKMLWQHNTDQVIGVWDTAQETDQGLYIKGRILDTSLGNDAYKLALAGAIDSMSIGYSPVDVDYDYNTGVRTLKSVQLWEVSLVTFPMNDKAQITVVKAAADDIDNAYDLLEQCSGMCDAYASGDMQPTPETLATISQMLGQAMTLLGDADAEEGKHTPRSVERALREAGLSKREARRFVAEAYQAIAPQRDADEQTLINLLNKFTS